MAVGLAVEVVGGDEGTKMAAVHPPGASRVLALSTAHDGGERGSG